MYLDRPSISELLRKMEALSRPVVEGGCLASGLGALDALVSGGFARGAMHEILGESAMDIFPALLARAAVSGGGRAIWCDSGGQLYPPGLQTLGLPLDRLMVLHPRNCGEELWAMNECLRCRGVAICIAGADRLSRLEARRLQLSAERGGGLGILLRPISARASPHAAASRWIVHPAPGERNLQRWRVELIHDRAGRVGQSVFLEWRRDVHGIRKTNSAGEADFVRAVETVADRPGTPQRIPASA